MATKNNGLFLKQTFLDVPSENGSQYRNLNLCQSYKCSDVFPVQSCSILRNRKNSATKKVDYTVENNQQENGNLQTLNKSMTSLNLSKDLNSNNGEAEKRLKKDFSNANKSTLSLHIEAYENSFEASNEFKDLTMKSDGAKFLGPWLNVQGHFEFPRQREDEEATSPEVMQFKASQKLLSPNQHKNHRNSKPGKSTSKTAAAADGEEDFKIVSLIDNLIEEAEATILRLDVNQKSFERTGKFAKNKGKKDEALYLNRFQNSPIKESSPPLSSSSKTLISSGSKSSLSTTTTSSSTATNSVTSSGPSLQRDPSILRLDPESYEILAQSSLSAVSKNDSNDKKRKDKNVATKGVDIFRFPLMGENPYLNSKDYIYSGLDSKNMLIVRDLQDGTVINEKEMKETEKYYKMLQSGKKCNKCPRILAPAPSVPSRSHLTTSIISPVSSKYSVQSIPDRIKSDSFSTSRMSSSVVTEDETTESTRPQSMLPQKVHSSASSKNHYKTASSGSASEMSFDFNFTAVMKDKKTGQAHPLHVVSKSVDGIPARVIINGKAFGPVQE